MCTALICGATTVAIGAALVVVSSVVGYYAVPSIVERAILNEVILLNDTIQMERFEEIPFPLEFRVRVFNISNAAEALAGGIPLMTEIGPYVYKLYQKRLIEKVEDDQLHYRIRLDAVFDPEASFPHTEDDLITVVNVAYHGILQVAEKNFPALLGILNIALPGVFGDTNGPIIETRVGDLMFDGITLCRNPGLLGGAACAVIRTMTTDIQNMELQPDNSLKFSVFSYRDAIPSVLYKIHRGIENHAELAHIISLDRQPNLSYWVDPEPSANDTSSVNATESTSQPSACNMINGTDSGIFAPFVDITKSLYAINTDICRSVELRYQYDTEYMGIPAVRFAANEWFLDNNEKCFCLNVTSGITREDGCLLEGAMELYSCVGAYLVLTYPHFLYADHRYRNGVRGMAPDKENHRLFMDLEPNTGTVIRGYKRAQFNIFMRAITGVPATQNFRDTLTPILWIEEGIAIPDEYASLLRDQLVFALNLVAILIPVVVALSATVLLTGITIILCIRFKKKTTV